MKNSMPDSRATCTQEEKKPLRTVQIVNVRWFNATAWYGITLARLLQSAGHETLLLGLGETESFETAQSLGLHPIAMPLTARNPLMQPVLLARLHRLFSRFKPDIVNCHRGESFALCGLLKPLLGFTLIRTRGDQRPPRNSAGNRWLHGRTADAVIATNSRIARCFTDEMHIPARQVSTILGGVDTRFFSFDPAGGQRVRAEFNIAPTDRLVGLLGRLDTVKGQLELIDAVARLRGQGIPARLLLVGHDTVLSSADIMERARAAGIAEHVIITGLRPDVAACISAFDIGVVASLYSEAIARAALEIMACGIPLVSTDIGVMPDLLPATAICPPNDISALAQRIALHLVDEQARNALLGDSAARMDGLSLEAFRDTTLAVYRAAMERKHAEHRATK